MMKKTALVLAACMALSSCADSMSFLGQKFEPFGLLSEDRRDPSVCYNVSWGNVFWGALLFETIIAPIYFFGFAMYEPVGLRTPGAVCDK
jgi:hypothetical protein